MKSWLIALIAVVALSMSGCAATVQSIGKEIAVETQGGIQRKITLYALDGHVIKVWQGRINVEGSEGESLFFIMDGKRYAISGQYSIEEE